MTQKGTGGVRDAIITYLTANLPAKLNAIDTAFGDGLVTDDPVNYLRSDGSVLSVPAFPIVVVKADRETVHKFGNAYTDGIYRFLIHVLIEDQEPETLEKRVERTAQAIWETMVDGEWAAAVAPIVGEQPEIAYSSTYTDPSNNYLAGATIRVSLRQLEAD